MVQPGLIVYTGSHLYKYHQVIGFQIQVMGRACKIEAVGIHVPAGIFSLVTHQELTGFTALYYRNAVCPFLPNQGVPFFKFYELWKGDVHTGYTSK